MALTYITEVDFESCAAELWRTHKLQPGFDVDDLVDKLGLGLVWDDIQDGTAGRVLGQLDPNDRAVILNQRYLSELEAREGRVRRYTLGHEIGHWLYHAEAARSGTLSLLQGGRVWCREGSRDPAERQAEMFSARLLMPRDRLHEELPKAPWRGWRPVYRLADTFLVSVTAMCIRLEELGWAHRDDSGEPAPGRASPPGQTQLSLA